MYGLLLRVYLPFLLVMCVVAFSHKKKFIGKMSTRYFIDIFRLLHKKMAQVFPSHRN